MFKVKSILTVLRVVLVFIMAGILVREALCSTSAPRHENSLGVVMQDTNPNTYIMGAIIDGAVVVDKSKSERRYATNIRFAPAYTYMLYDESVLFCGNRAQDFNGKVGAIVVTYERVAHQTFEGLGCHDLVSVDNVVSKDPTN